ncbi:hypothetical protein ACMHYB_24410 [Sorangium sp. So ce1128]
MDALRHLTSDVPVVAVEGGRTTQHGGVVVATQHRLDLGHRTVWHIAGSTEGDQRSWSCVVVDPGQVAGNSGRVAATPVGSPQPGSGRRVVQSAIIAAELPLATLSCGR